MDIQKLTKAEEDIMHEIWNLEPCSVYDIIENLPEPKPAYNTVSTVVRILEAKQFVDHISKGRGFQYFSKIDKEVYSKITLNTIVEKHFQGSLKSMISFFMKEKEMDLQELESILDDLKKTNSHE